MGYKRNVKSVTPLKSHGKIGANDEQEPILEILNFILFYFNLP